MKCYFGHVVRSGLSLAALLIAVLTGSSVVTAAPSGSIKIIDITAASGHSVKQVGMKDRRYHPGYRRNFHRRNFYGDNRGRLNMYGPKGRYHSPLRGHRKYHRNGLRKLHPYTDRYIPRRYRYSCAYDKWANSNPKYRRYCEGIGIHLYKPKGYYKRNRYYRGHPYMRRHLRNLQRRWY